MNTILISGTSRGLGKVLVDILPNYNNKVIPHCRTIEQLNNITNNYFTSDFVVGDLYHEGTYEHIDTVLRRNNVNVLINNAGVYSCKPFDKMTTEEIMNVININLIAQMLVTRKVYKYFREKNKGYIININSLAGKYPSANETIYSASKAGFAAFSKSLQLESLNTNIRFTDIFLGAMRTDMCKDRYNYNDLIKPIDVANQINQLINMDCSLIPTKIILRRRRSK